MVVIVMMRLLLLIGIGVAGLIGVSKQVTGG
jgi:hypothetical protein